MNLSSIKRNAFLNILRTLLSIIFPLITFPYATRVLQPEGIGKVQFSAGIISYFVMFAGLGIGTYGIRETAKKRDNRQELIKVTKELFVLNLIPTTIAYLLFGLALFVIPKFSSYRNLLIIYSSIILFTTIGIEWLYSGLEQYAYITIRQFIFQLFSLILLFIFVRQKNDVVKYGAICVFANVVANVCNFIHSRKYINWRKPVKLELKHHLKPVFILFGMRVAASLYVTLDTTLLGFLSGDAQVGYYESANKMTRIVVSLITCVTAVMLPRLSYFVEKNDKESFNNLIRQSFDILLLFSLPMTAGLFVLRNNIITIISGSRFLPAVPVMGILVPLVLVIPLSSFMGNQIFLPLGKENISFYAMFTGAVINLGLSVFLIKKYDAFGAAFASLLAETCITIFYFVVAIKQKLFSASKKSIVHYLFSTVFIATIIYLINCLNTNLYLKTILSIILGICFYAIALIILRDETFFNLYGQIKERLLKKK